MTEKDLDDAMEELAQEVQKNVLTAVPNEKQPLAFGEAETSREVLKQRIRFAYNHAKKDLEYSERAIADIDRAMELQQATRNGLEAMRDEARERIIKAQFAMARFL